MTAWTWAIGALAVAVLEIFVPGAYLIWIGAGGAVTALASFIFPLALPAQLGVFIVASSVSCIAGYFVYQNLIKRPSGEAALNQRGLELVGATGIVFETMHNGHGKVSLGDSVWLAEGPDLAVGASIVVTATRGTVLIVAAR